MALLTLTPLVSSAQTQTLTLHWSPNPPADQVTSYQVCIGTSSKKCDTSQASVPSTQTSFTFTPSPGVLYYLAVRAYSGSKQGSLSVEVKTSIPGFPQPSPQKSTINAPIAPFNLGIVDPDGGTLQYTYAGLPIGLSLNPSTGLITGTPTTLGTYNTTVSVYDGIVTVSRSFTWTIGDATPPIVTVTSHALNQAVSSATITVSGTATDYGAGGNGVASVTVNGLSATSGAAATGNAIAAWSRTLTLTSGVNVIRVQATDGAGNVGTVQVTLSLGSTSGSSSGSSMTGVSFTSNVAGPQVAGTQITFSAAGVGGVTPYQYQWFAQLNAGAWQVLNGWSTAATYTWTPTLPGTYVIALWARSAGATVNAWQAYAERVVVVNPAPGGVVLPPVSTPPPSTSSSMTSASLVPNVASPRPVGTAVTFTASGSGGTTPYQYQWYVQQGSGAFQLVRAWSTTSTYTWAPTQAGTYTIALWARSNGATTTTWQAYAERTFTITAPTSAGVVARDTFTGSNGTALGSHPPDVSPSTMWVQHQGTGSRLLSGWAAPGTSLGYTISTLETGTSTGSVAMDVSSIGSIPYAGIVFRAVDANRMLLLRYSGNASIGLLGLFRRVNGNFELLNQVTMSPLVPNTVHRMEVRFKGSKVQAYWNGGLMLVMDIADYQTATQHGLLWHSDDPFARFDNFVIDTTNTP